MAPAAEAHGDGQRLTCEMTGVKVCLLNWMVDVEFHFTEDTSFADKFPPLGCIFRSNESLLRARHRRRVVCTSGAHAPVAITHSFPTDTGQDLILRIFSLVLRRNGGGVLHSFGRRWTHSCRSGPRAGLAHLSPACRWMWMGSIDLGCMCKMCENKIEYALFLMMFCSATCKNKLLQSTLSIPKWFFHAVSSSMRRRRTV